MKKLVFFLTVVSLLCFTAVFSSAAVKPTAVKADSAVYIADDGFARGFDYKTTVNNAKAQFRSPVVIRSENNAVLSGTSYVGTGDIICSQSDNRRLMTVVLDGDVNGNGKVESTDAIYIRSAFLQTAMGQNVVAGTPYFAAADLNGNHKVDSNDYIRVQMYILHKLTVPGASRPAQIYAEPQYLVDFTDPDMTDGVSGINAVSVTPDHGMKVLFHDTQNGMCGDPYLSLPIPMQVSSTQYPYLAMLVKTDRPDLSGEFRYMTTDTAGAYPCVFISYQRTDDLQLVVLNLTDRSAVHYISDTTPLTGNYTNFRIDFFNDCPADTQYTLLAYALFENEADARSFAMFESNYQPKQEVLPDIQYADFWKGEAYASPADAYRMRYLTFGFNDTTPIDTFLRRGFGGVISNVKFNQQYLKDDGEFALLSEVYRYASDRGMATWIYDEYQWPSGKAYGQVLDGHPEYEATGIEHRRITGTSASVSYAISGRDIRIMQADLTDSSGSRSLSLSANGASLSATANGAWTLDVYVRRYTHSGVENRADFSTLRDVDLLNPNAVDRFIELTHQKYKDEMGENFDLVEAFFTDEPNLGNRGKLSYVVWTENLDTMYRETYGSAINYASLFSGDTNADRACRLNYYRLVSSLFRTSYIDRIAAWCEANGVASSGHLLFEEYMCDQIETYGGDFMQIVGDMTIPGVDLLWVSPEKLMLPESNIGSFAGIRYVASAAKNASKTDVMVEFNPNAVNTLSQEDPLSECIAGVSLTRLLGTTIYNVIDVNNILPADQYRELNTYTARLNTLMDGMTECGELAVFYPIATVQAFRDADTGHGSEKGNGTAYADTVDATFRSLCYDLLTNRYLYTVIDDESLVAATVQNGRLVIGNGSYSTVILPMTQYISLQAMSKLLNFTSAGGNVIFYGDTPAHGLKLNQESLIAVRFKQMTACPRYTAGSAQLIADLPNYVARPSVISGSGMRSVLSGDFENEDVTLTYLANITSQNASVSVTFSENTSASVSVYFPRTAQIKVITPVNGRVSVTVPANEAVLLVREK